jgi:MFS family permease
MYRIEESGERAQDRRRLSSGWIVVVGACMSFAIGAGLMHSYGVFLVAFLEEFRWSRAETSIAYAVSQLISGLSAPVIGVAVDRLGPRLLVLSGGTLLVIGLAASAYVSSLWHLIVLYGLVMTVGAKCLSPVVFVPLISRWFVRQRGTAVGILQSANSVGRAASAPLVQLLIATIGWRGSYLALSALMAALLLPLVRLFRPHEPDATALPNAREATEPSGVSVYIAPLTPSRDWSLWQAMQTVHFWLLFGAYLCTGLGAYFVSLHQLAFAVDVGFDKLYAASVLGTGSLLAVAGTILSGTLSDYIGRELAAILAYGISILGVLCALPITSAEQTWLLWLHACFFGIALGAKVSAITAKTADLFPGQHLGAILGVITIGTGIGAALGSWASGLIYDLSGSYRLAFLLSILSYLGGGVAFWFLRRLPAREVGEHL